MRLKIISPFFLLLCIPLISGAQLVKRYNTFSYGVNNGLLQSSILDMAIDKNNFCWISYPNGIQKFDGNTFTNIPVQKGLPDDKAVTFLRLSNGNLIIMHAQGISLYDVESNYFKQVVYFNKTPEDEITLLGEYGHVVYQWNSFDEIVGLDLTTFKEVSRKKVGFPPGVGRKEVKLSSNIKNGNIILYSGGHIILWSFKNSAMIGEPLKIPNTLPGSFYLISPTKALFAQHYKATFLNSLSFEDGKITTLFHLKYIAAVVGGRCDLLQWDNKFLFLYKNTLYESDSSSPCPKSKIVNFQGQDISKISSFSHIKIDNFGNLIVSTVQDGIRKIIKNNFPINLYSASPASNNFVLSVLPDKSNNNILAGIMGNGVFVFDTLQQIKKHINSSVYGLGSKTPVAIIKNRNNEYLVFYWAEKVVWKLNQNLSQPVPLPIICKDTSLSPSIRYYTKTAYLDDHTAMVVSENKLYKINLVNNTIRCHLITSGLPMSALAYNASIITHTKDSLYFFDTASITLVKKIYFPNTGGVRSFAKGLHGEIYLGTNKGVYHIDTTGKIVQHWDKKWGLPDECIYAIEIDKQGRLWCSTNKGLIRINKSNQVLSLTREDGLQENEFNTNVSAIANDGELFFGGVNGISSFFPLRIFDIDENVNILLTDIKVNGSNIFGDSAIWKLKSITLPYHLNSLVFDFIAIGPQNPEQYLFHYRMKGFDNSWIQNSKQQPIRYLLPPGRYVLQVYASRSLDKSPIPLKEIYITIKPAFWKTWWFAALMVLLSLLVVFGSIYFYLRRKFKRKLIKLEEEKKLQLERERISRNLHDSVGAYANAVLYNTELLAEEKEEGKKSQIMADLKDASKDIITSLRETIWAFKKENYTAEECLIRIKNFIQPFNHYYPGKSFIVKGSAPSNYILHYSNALNLVRIVQEAVTNALKHSHSPSVEVKSFEENNKWIIEITDYGKGFPVTEETITGGNGLNNMKKRSIEAGFEWDILSNENGTTIRIVIP